MAGLWNFASRRVHTRTGSGLLRIAARSGPERRYRDCCNRLCPAVEHISDFADTGRRSRLAARPSLAGVAASRRGAPGRRMIWAKLIFGGFGRRGLEAVVALAVLAVAAAIVAGALMVIEGARAAMARPDREDRPGSIQVKS